MISKAIASANPKGGVGKTTTTVDFGAGLANEGNKGLRIDADPEVDLSKYPGKQIRISVLRNANMSGKKLIQGPHLK